MLVCFYGPQNALHDTPVTADRTNQLASAPALTSSTLKVEIL